MDMPNHFDVLEIVYIPNLTNGKYDLSEQEFTSWLSKARRLGLRPFDVDTKEYFDKNMVMTRKIEQGACVETKVFQTSTLDVIDVQPFYRYIYSNKKKLSPVAFPSTKDHDAVVRKRRTVFRVNNRIYLNFEQEIPENGQGSYKKIYINFNNGKDADLKESMDTIDNLLRRLFN